MGRLRAAILKRAVVLLCALALMLVGFAHRTPSADTNLSNPELAAYLALGASLADLCLSDKGAEGGTQIAECPACTLAKAMAIAPSYAMSPEMVSWSTERLVIADSPIFTGSNSHAPPARGPPPTQLI